MSQFLPDKGTSIDPGSGKSDWLKPQESELGNLNPRDAETWRKFNGTVDGITPEFKAWLKDFFLTVVVPEIPIEQVAGFKGYNANHAEVLTSENISSTSYTNLATTGPEITGLSDGVYVVWFGAIFDSTAGGDGFMSPSFNGTTPSDAEAAFANASIALRYGLSRAVQRTLTNNGDNSIRMQYRVTSGTNAFKYRWMIAQKVGTA